MQTEWCSLGSDSVRGASGENIVTMTEPVPAATGRPTAEECVQRIGRSPQCAGHAHDDDFAQATWRKSSRSGNATAQCVQVATTGSRVAIRDSQDPHGGMLIVDLPQWRAFIADVTRSTTTRR